MHNEVFVLQYYVNKKVQSSSFLRFGLESIFRKCQLESFGFEHVSLTLKISDSFVTLAFVALQDILNLLFMFIKSVAPSRDPIQGTAH